MQRRKLSVELSYNTQLILKHCDLTTNAPPPPSQKKQRYTYLFFTLVRHVLLNSEK